VGDALVRVHSSHLDTRPRAPDDSWRAMQGAEARADSALPGRPSRQVFAGDLNTWTCNPTVANCAVPPAAEQVIEDFLDAGWRDGTDGWNGWTQLGEGFFPQRLDWIFFRGLDTTPGRGISGIPGSDHFPVVFHFRLEE
jgi:endonuclease/exonuclease/phosphatase family metal-dependent hydrolase